MSVYIALGIHHVVIELTHSLSLVATGTPISWKVCGPFFGGFPPKLCGLGAGEIVTAGLVITGNVCADDFL